MIQTYSWISRYYYQFASQYFSYIAIDEAHHAVAPTLQKVIHHFNPETLLGLTATDRRFDEKKLQDIFGKYEIDFLPRIVVTNSVEDIFKLKDELTISVYSPGMENEKLQKISLITKDILELADIIH